MQVRQESAKARDWDPLATGTFADPAGHLR